VLPSKASVVRFCSSFLKKLEATRSPTLTANEKVDCLLIL